MSDMFDKLSSVSGEITNVSQSVQAYIYLIDENNRKDNLFDHTEVILCGLAGIMDHLGRIANDLDNLSLSVSKTNEGRT